MWSPKDEIFSPEKNLSSVPHPYLLPSHQLPRRPDTFMPPTLVHPSTPAFNPQVFATVSHLAKRSSPTIYTGFSSVNHGTPRPFNQKSTTTNVMSDDESERKKKREEVNGMNTVIRPILPYVDLLKKESGESPLCEHHIRVQKELEEHPKVININGMDDGMEMKKIVEDESKIEICALFDDSSSSQVDHTLCNRDMMRRRKTTQEIIDELSSVDNPSPFLISAFAFSLSEGLLSMDGNQRQSLLVNLRCSLPTLVALPPLLPLTECQTTRVRDRDAE